MNPKNPGPLLAQVNVNNIQTPRCVLENGMWIGRWRSILFIFGSCFFAPCLARALPSFARQTSLSCVVCHTSYPELTSFGRQFKLNGYTISTGQSNLPPLAVMLEPSFTNTRKAQVGGAAPGYSENNNVAITQASLFYAGRLFGPYSSDLFGTNIAPIVDKLGVFLQATYDGIGKTWSWDNAEIRYADTAQIAGSQATWGVYANNNPMLQDPWNSTTAWGFPFTSSGLASEPGAGALIDGGLAQQVAGVGTYAMLDNTVYLDFGAYHTLGGHLQKSLGIDTNGETQISGLAPYWRVAVEKPLGGGTLEIGTFGLAADAFPGRDSGAGHDQTVDFGLDSQYQFSLAKGDVSGTLLWIDEHQKLAASKTLGVTSNTVNSLSTFRATVHYLYDKTYGFSVQYFALNGNRDALLYAESAVGSPNSNGLVFQLDFIPFNKNGGPKFWPKSNVKMSVQFTAYNKFNGARDNYDGAGANARDNNTLYVETWIVF